MSVFLFLSSVAGSLSQLQTTFIGVRTGLPRSPLTLCMSWDGGWAVLSFSIWSLTLYLSDVARSGSLSYTNAWATRNQWGMPRIPLVPHRAWDRHWTNLSFSIWSLALYLTFSVNIINRVLQTKQMVNMFCQFSKWKPFFWYQLTAFHCNRKP